MFVLYVVMAHVAFLLLLPVLFLHPKLREGFRMRLGMGAASFRAPAPARTIWLHGASTGDLAALQPVIRRLRAERTNLRLVVTTVTNSGMAWARKYLGEVDTLGFLPFDLPWAVGRVVRAIAPDVLVLEYAEVWPALIRSVHRSGSRIVITNGRFHEQALARYRLLYRLIGNPLRFVDQLCMRDDAEAAHALAIGAPAQRVCVCGNTKFDSSHIAPHLDEAGLAQLAQALGIEEGRQVFVCGSTHEGEEGPLLDTYGALRAHHPGLHLVIAPRYMERVPRILSLARDRDLACGLRSQGAAGSDVAILDTVGELRDAYRLATVVFVGGSFTSRGGQNIIEPAHAGKPVLFGPHMENFKDSVRMLVGRGAIQVGTPRRLQVVLGELLDKPDEMLHLGRMAQETVASVQGAAERCAKSILAQLDQQPGTRNHA